MKQYFLFHLPTSVKVCLTTTFKTHDEASSFLADKVFLYLSTANAFLVYPKEIVETLGIKAGELTSLLRGQTGHYVDRAEFDIVCEEIKSPSEPVVVKEEDE